MAITGGTSPDIELLFGVAGGGSASGESGSLIKEQLDKLVKSLNTKTEVKGRGVALSLDVTGTKKNFTEGLKQVVGSLSGQKQFKIKVSQIDATSAINKLKSDLDTMLKTIKVDTGFAVTIGENGASSAVKEIGREAKESVMSVSEATAALKAFEQVNSSLTSGYKKSSNFLNREKATEEEVAEAAKLEAEYRRLLTVTEELKFKKNELTEADIAAAKVQQGNVRNIIDSALVAKSKADVAVKAAQKEAEAEGNVNQTRKSAIALLKQVNSLLANSTSAKKTDDYASLESIKGSLNAMLNGTSGAVGLSHEALESLRVDFDRCRASIVGTGKASKSFGDTLATNAKKFANWFSASQLFMRAFNAAIGMVKAVKKIDTAMTELRKVTDETDTAYVSFLENATKRAKKLGADVSDTVTASADFARLGYTMDEAADLADAALVYKNVGDGIENISDASESIISTMKAFRIEAEDAMLVVDKFNEVGNNFAISSEGVGEALLRSASALSAANNSLDESIALITAANSVVQDPDSVGTAMKTLSMYLRAAKTEAEEAGESTDGMADSVSELRSEVLSLTGGKVDIQVNEDTFKSTYQIIKELSQVWGELTDVSQANLLEMLGGKRNSNVLSALLENFDIASDVVNTTSNATGSALAENEKYLDSISGKLSALSATYESLSEHLIDSDLVKWGLDVADGLLSIVDALAEINLALPTTIALVIALTEAKKNRDAMNSVTDNAMLLITENKLDKEKYEKELDSLKALFNELSPERQRGVLDALTEQLTAQEKLKKETDRLTDAQIAGKISSLGLKAATEEQTVANHSLAASIKAVMASNPFGWVLLAISLIPTVVSLVDSLHKSNDELIQDGEELRKQYAETLKSTSSDIKTLSSLEDEFTELSKGVDRYGNNISLAADDYERYQEVVSNILDISPELISGYDSEGRALANNNGLLEEAIRLRKEEQKLALKEHFSEDNAKTTAKGIIAKADPADATGGTLADGYYNPSLNDSRGYSYQSSTGALTKQVFSEIGIALSSNKYTSGDQIYENWKYIQEHYKELSRIISEVFASNTEAGEDLLSYVDTAIKNMSTAQGDLEDELLLKAQTSDYYDELTAAEKSFLNEYVKTFDVATATTKNDILEMEQAVLNLTNNLGTNAEFGELISLRDRLESGVDELGNALSVGEYKNKTQQFVDAVSGSSDDIKQVISKVFNFDQDKPLITDVDRAINHVKGLLIQVDSGHYDNLKEMQEFVDSMSTAEVLDIYYNLSAAHGSVTIEELQEFLASRFVDTGSLTGEIDKISTIEEQFKQLAETMAQFKDDGALTADDFAEFTEVFGKLDNFESYVEVLSNTASTAEEVRLASEQLAEEFITNSNVLDDLSESNAELVVRMLDAIGVTNAAEIVEAKLNVARMENLLQTKGLSNATWDEASARLSAYGATETQLNALKRYRQEQYNATLAATNFNKVTAEQISLLISQAKMAGATAEQLTMLTRIEQRSNRYSEISELAKSDPASFFHIYGVSASESYRVTDPILKEIESLTQRVQTFDVDPIVNFDVDLSKVKLSSSSSGKNSTKEVDEYLADLDRLYKKKEKLSRQELVVQRIGDRLSGTDDLKEQIALNESLIEEYKEEQRQLHELAGAADENGTYAYDTARAEIQENLKSLKELYGITAEYDPEKNELLIQNMERINELTVDRKKYESDADWQEAVNDRRKAAEELIDGIIDQVDTTKEWSAAWIDAQYSILSAKKEIVEALKEMVSEASEALDSVQDAYTTLQNAADEYAANDGFISVDSFQGIINLGSDYMQYLTDENGLLVINKKAIEDLTKARTRQMAITAALTFIERVKNAAEKDSIENLNELIFGAQAYSDTWDSLYDDLLTFYRITGKLSEEQYEGAKHVLDVYKALEEGVTGSVGLVTNSIETMQSAFDEIISYVEKMIQSEVSQQVEALEELKTKYGELIEARKKALRAAKDEDDYQDSVLEKTKKLADLQAKIDLLSLDDSRDAQAQKKALMEEMAELQKELADLQRDHSIEQQEESLDAMQKAYEEEKDSEIEELEDSISSAEKLHRLALERIDSYTKETWSNLLDELKANNLEFGSDLERDLCTAFEEATTAAERWGYNVKNIIDGLNSGGGDDDSEQTTGGGWSASDNAIVAGQLPYGLSSTAYRTVCDEVSEMKKNAQQWSGANTLLREQLQQDNVTIAGGLNEKYGLGLYRGPADGVWYLKDGRKLFDVFHTGGIAGGGTLKENETLAILQNGEPIISNADKQSLFDLIDFVSVIGKKMSNLYESQMFPRVTARPSYLPESTTMTTTVQIGDTYIYGGNEETVRRHQAITREQTNEILRYLEGRT